MRRFILGLGSNKGNSETILHSAIEELRVVLRNMRAASFYKTKPMHIESQPLFINTAVIGEFGEPPSVLLERIHEIEQRFGRDRANEIRWGQRSLDIDILLSGDLILRENNLHIPHPRLCERRFALEPLLELDEDAVHPVLGEPLRFICRRLPDQGVEKL